MTPCATCERMHDNDSPMNKRGWMCMAFERDEVNEVTGDRMPPYHYCRDVRRITVKNPKVGDCLFWEPKRQSQETE